VQKSFGLLASVAVASWEAGSVPGGLDPVQAPGEEAAPAPRSFQMGGFRLSLLQ